MVFRVTIDNRLKIPGKLNSLTIIAPYLNHNLIKLICMLFFMWKRSYCPLICIITRSANHLINKLQERLIRIACNDYNSRFSEFLQIANESTILIRNLTFPVVKIYKFLNGLSSPIMNEVFQINDCHYSLKNLRVLASKRKSSKKCSIHTIRGPQIWQNISLEIRNSE